MNFVAALQNYTLSVDSFIVTMGWRDDSRLTAVLYLATIAVLGTLGNMATILVTLTTSDLCSPCSNCLLINLSLSDILTAVFIIPITLDVLIWNQWRFSDNFRLIVAYAHFTTCLNSVMTITVVSVERYLYVQRPMRYKAYVTKERVRLTCALIWVLSLLMTLPLIVGFGSVFCFIPNISACFAETLSKSGFLVYSLVVLALSFGMAIVIMFCCYMKIMHVVLRQSRRIANLGSFSDSSGMTATVPVVPSIGQRAVKSKKAIRTLAFIMLGFIACWSPFVIVSTIQFIQRTPYSPTIKLICLWIGYSSICINVFIYHVRYRNFRRQLRNLGCRLRRLVFERSQVD